MLESDAGVQILALPLTSFVTLSVYLTSQSCSFFMCVPISQDCYEDGFVNICKAAVTAPGTGISTTKMSVVIFFSLVQYLGWGDKATGHISDLLQI